MKYEYVEETLPMVSEVSLRYKSKVDQSQRKKVLCSLDVANIVRSFGEMQENIGFRELFYAVMLNKSNTVLAAVKIAEGGMNSVQVDVRMIMQAALLTAASAFAIVHNHPSGSISPSREDIRMTNRLKEIGDLLDIQLIDSIIITEDPARTYSFSDEGRL